VLQRFRDEGFPEDLFIFSKKPMRKITASLSYPEDRAFIAYYDQGDMVQVALKGLTTRTAKIIIIPSFFYGPALQAGYLIAKAKKMDIFMDGNFSSSETIQQPQIRDALKKVRFYSPNSKEARNITQENNLEKAAKTLGGFCQTVIIKDGCNGAYCFDNGKLYFEPAFPVKVVDTTGAGDCFNAGFVKAWLLQKPIQECLQWGVAAGGLSTTMPGANNYRQSADQIEKLISRREK
jgi:sugar/nucleoside kinase (ribokinase family)